MKKILSILLSLFLIGSLTVSAFAINDNEYIPNNPDKAWIKEVYSKAVKHSIEDGYTAFTRFFKHQSSFPKFKKKGKSDVKMYFVRNNIDLDVAAFW